MRIRHIIVPVLLVVAAGSAAIIGMALVQFFTGDELNHFCSSLQVVIFVFTASGGLLALIKYWGSVEAELEQKRWEKLRHLDEIYQRFRDRHGRVIQAFDYSHILRAEYLPLCVKAIAYGEAERDAQAKILTPAEMAKVRELDDFLEVFETLHFAISRGLVKMDDLLVFLQYYVLLIGNAYFDKQDRRLREYVDRYYFTIQSFLDEAESALRKYLETHPKERLIYMFPNYPRALVDTAPVESSTIGGESSAAAEG